MEEKESLERRRQVFHLLLGTFIVILYKIGILNTSILFIIFLAGFTLSVLSFRYNVPGIKWFLKRFEREEDFKKSPGKGCLMYISGVLITLLVFKEEIALAAIMILAVGDSVSHMIGKYFGRYKFSNAKHLEGTLAGIFFAGLVASMFVDYKLAFIGSVVGMLTEVVDLKIGKMEIDDNLIIPILAGLTMHLAQNTAITGLVTAIAGFV
ncbi:hypothetical protein FJZ53_02900 [Candidatus Woesearchaeota archaeon]|nr:hypothetical protein [Candidatus Woesearchaeota archaeon]